VWLGQETSCSLFLQEALLCFLIWVERCEAQIGGVLDVLENERAAVAAPFWFGERIGYADIAVACTLRFTGEAHPGLFGEAHYPALAAHAARCEALPPFQQIVQKLNPPSG
jgi:glutathione S-transferase